MLQRRGNLLVEGSSGNNLPAEFLGEEKERLLLLRIVEARNIQRTADGAAEVVFLVLGHRRLEEVTRVEGVVPDEFEQVSVEILGTRFRNRLNGPRRVSAVLCAEVRGQDLYLGYGIHVRVDVECAVASVVHVVAAVDLPVVVFGAPAVDAHGYVAGDADRPFVLAGLIADSRNQGDQLRKITAVEDDLADLFSGDHTRQFRGLGLYLGNRSTLHGDFAGNLSDFQAGVDTRLLAHAQNDAGSFVGLEAGGCDPQVVGGLWQARH